MNRTKLFELQKGTGRKKIKEIDLDQLKNIIADKYETIRIVEKNPFLWHDHCPIKDYAKI